MILSPSCVMMLSGWNCTPWIFGYFPCLTAMIVSSSVHAVTSSSSSGKFSLEMTKLWYLAASNGARRSVEHRPRVLGVPHGAALPVHQPARRADDVAAEHLADALVPHANAEDAELGAQNLARLERDARVLGAPGAGGDHDAPGIHGGDLSHRLLVVLVHHVLAPEVAEVLLVGREGVVRWG